MATSTLDALWRDEYIDRVFVLRMILLDEHLVEYQVANSKLRSTSYRSIAVAVLLWEGLRCYTRKRQRYCCDIIVILNIEYSYYKSTVLDILRIPAVDIRGCTQQPLHRSKHKLCPATKPWQRCGTAATPERAREHKRAGAKIDKQTTLFLADSLCASTQQYNTSMFPPPAVRCC